jgi:predicted RNase H-like HicB family nuclease
MTDEPFALFLEGRRVQLCENPKYIPKENPMKLTAVFMEVPEGYIAFIEELPGANTQGETLEETRKNLKEAVQMVLDANREVAARSIAGKQVSREPFNLSSS